MRTTDGSNPTALRYRNLRSDGAEVFCEEERSNDRETGHVTEEVGYVVFDGNDAVRGPAT
jgi:hypothetical protein